MARMYEGMFLIEPTIASKEWDKVVANVHGLLKKYDFTIKSTTKWAERKLAYEVKKHKRGTYLLTYFEGPQDGIAKVRRECELSETILRALILLHQKGAKIVDTVAPPLREDERRGVMSVGGPRGPRFGPR